MKNKGLSRSEFVQALCNEVGAYGEEVVMDVYYSLERLITKRLLSHGEIALPDIGDFYLREHKETSRMVWKGEERVSVISPRACKMKFRPDYKKRAYFDNVVKRG